MALQQIVNIRCFNSTSVSLLSTAAPAKLPSATHSNVSVAQREPNDPLNMWVRSYELKSGQLPNNMEHGACQELQAHGQTGSAQRVHRVQEQPSGVQ